MRAVVARLGVLAAGLVVVAIGGALLAGLLTEGDRGGPVVGSEFPATAMDLGRGYANNSPILLADPTEGRFVVMANRLDAPDFSCALQVSGDGGRTWEPSNPVPKLPEGAEKCYAPEVAFDADGTLYYLFVGLEGAGNQPMGAFLSTSADRARTFSEPRRVLGPRNYAVRMAMDGDRDRLHLVWLHAGTDPPLGGFNAGPNPIQAAYSDDGGRTFSGPVTVAGAGAERVVAPALTLGPSGDVHVAFYDLQDDVRDYQGLEGPTWERTWGIRLATSSDGGRRFGDPIAVDDGIVPDERVILIFTMPAPSLVAGDGRICAAWTDARNGDPDALLRCSSDGGGTWGELRRLNDDGAGNGRAQYQPRLGLAPDGRLDAVFYDRRNDADNVLNQVFYTYSTDGAATFTPNRLLTTDPSTTRVGQRYTNTSAQGLVEFGSRMGLLSTDGEAVAAWTDTRNSRSGTSQDLFSATVTFPEGSGPVWARVVGGGLLAAGLVLLVVAARPRRATPVGEEQPS
ncbi:MAG: exo-alpha-sialidase [Acidimicrobiales bacterium]